ncbi:MAG: ATP-binding protein [Lachnospiraceae bacterium]|nr:ATP-binding protein [Lachnospiraceae bacterium]
MVQKIFPANDIFLKDVMTFTEEEMVKVNVSTKVITQVKICVEEIFVNIAHYAYGDEKGEAKISILYDEYKNAMTFIFEDEGVPYNPLDKSDPDTTLSAEERKIGGLGIFICKKTMDDIQYKYENGKNILSMTKTLDSKYL